MTRSFAVRPYQQADLQAVVDLFRRSVRELAARDYTAAQLSAWAPEVPDLNAWAARLETGGVFVCARDVQIIGFGRIDHTGVVDLLYVDPSCAREGVATALMNEVFAWARQHGLRRLFADASITALAFFERSGFRVRRLQAVERCEISLASFRMERDFGDA